MIGNILTVLVIFKVFHQVAPQFFDQAVSENLKCLAQKTPLYGKKWCKFNQTANELGAVCTFTCIKGYELKGPSENTCMLTLGGHAAYFIPLSGICKRIVPLKDGKNGPYKIHTMENSEHFLTSGDFLSRGRVPTEIYNTFYVTKPGVNGVEGTMSLSVSAYPNDYLVQKGVNLMLQNSSNSKNEEQWRNDASFWIQANQFYEGFYTFESYSTPNYFINFGNQGVKMKQLSSEDDHRASSFKWTSVSS